MAANTVKKTSVKKTESRKGSRQTASGGAKGKQRTKSVSSRTKQQTARTPVQTQTGENPMILREAALWLILAACVFIFISYFGVGGFVGSVISDVSFGVFGAAAYLFPFLIFIAAAFLISNRGSKTALIKFFFRCVLIFMCYQLCGADSKRLSGRGSSVSNLYGKRYIPNRRRRYRRICLLCSLSCSGNSGDRRRACRPDDYLFNSHYSEIIDRRAAQAEPPGLRKC